MLFKKLVSLILMVVLVVSFNTTTFAQNATPTSQPPAEINPAGEPVDEVKDLVFPIEDLGGCEDYKACLTYCDDPVNNAACIDFAKKKGFYKDDPVMAPTEEFMTKAKDVLGCETSDACLTLCSDPANYEKCDAFAKSQGIPGGGYVEEPDKPEFIDKAKESLGCTDSQSCTAFCDDSTNADKCDQFSDEVGLLGGQVPEGPGGCTSNQTCANYCSDPANFEICKTFTGGGNFSGPGGCNTKEECRTYCEENPDTCRSYAPGSNGVYVPAVCPTNQTFGPGGVCVASDKIDEAASCAQGGGFWQRGGCIVNFDDVPSGIHPNVGGAYYQPRPEMGNCSTPGACYDFCKENPGKCPSFDTNVSRPVDGYIPSLYYTPGTEVKFPPKADMGNCDSPGACYDFCKENPGKCGGFDSKAPRPVDTYLPGTYYTPSTDQRYYTPPITGFYVTPIYFTPPVGSNYTTPSYYTPGMYSTPSYYTPFAGSNYSTPSYYSPGSYYPTPTNGQYPTPNYSTPTYYTPPTLAGYNTPTYYTPPQYTTPTYPTPPAGSNYTTPTYNTPPAYTTPQYYTPYTGGTYSTPVYYTPPVGSNYTTPSYSSPSYYYPTPTGGYATPTYSYPTPGGSYTSPTYYTPGGSYYYPSPYGGYSSPSYYYPTPGSGYTSPASYTSPSYYSPSGTYPTPTYPTPAAYSYPTPGSGYTSPAPYTSPSYSTPGSYGYPTPGGTYVSPYSSSGSYSYPSPSDGYTYPTPYIAPGYATPTSYYYPTPSSYSYPSPSYSYPSPSYGSPSYGSPSYGTPEYSSPSYGSPSYGTPPTVQGASTDRNILQIVWDWLTH